MQNNSIMLDGGENKAEPATQIIEEVAKAKCVDPLDLSLIRKKVPPEAINDLCQNTSCDIEVTFEYEGYRVTVTEDGRVLLDGSDLY